MTHGPERVLVLAGSRGPADPMAMHAAVSHKCLIPVAGTAMIERVVATLGSLSPAPHIVIAIERAEILDALPGIAAARAQGRLEVIGTAESPSRTLLAALRQQLIAPPFLVTTADHPLLTPAMIDWFWSRVPAGIDAAAAVAQAGTIRGAWPTTKRTYLRFRDGSYSGCNLFAVMSARAGDVIAFWQGAEAKRKRPAAMIRLLGTGATLRFLLGAMPLAGALAHLGRLSGTQLAAVTLPFAEAAIDVDKPEDLELAEQILAARAAPAPALVRTADAES